MAVPLLLALLSGEEERRSQGPLSCVPDQPPAARPDAWRRIEVRMTPSRLTARTISGYYP